ncbi:MAG: hypothetical protein KIT73_13180, partial [Burkholderiales bacterium]|nr:hypothetical protein [Burkholderiales bacterium]
RAGRLKQWLNLLRRRHPQAERAYVDVRGITDPSDVSRWLLAQCTASAAPTSSASTDSQQDLIAVA